MFSNRESHETIDDEDAIRAVMEAQRIENAIPEHLLPNCYQTFPTDTEDQWSLTRRLLAAMYDGQLWLWQASLKTVKSIVNAVWQRDVEIQQQVSLLSLFVKFIFATRTVIVTSMI